MTNLKNDSIVVVMPVPSKGYGPWSVAPNTRITYEHPKDRFNKPKAFLNSEEIEFFQKELNVSDMSQNAEFWKDWKVVLTSKPEYLDLNIPEQKLMYLYLKNCVKAVANSKSDIKPYTQFYMFNEVEESKVEVAKFDKELTAYTYIHNMSMEDQASFLKLYGFRTNSMSPIVIKKKLKEVADENPDLFIRKYEDNNKEYRIILEDLIQNKIVTVKNGAYYFNEDMLGADADLAVDKLKNPKNSDLLLVLKKQLNDKSEPKKSKTK